MAYEDRTIALRIFRLPTRRGRVAEPNRQYRWTSERAMHGRNVKARARTWDGAMPITPTATTAAWAAKRRGSPPGHQAWGSASHRRRRRPSGCEQGLCQPIRVAALEPFGTRRPKKERCDLKVEAMEGPRSVVRSQALPSRERRSCPRGFDARLPAGGRLMLRPKTPLVANPDGGRGHRGPSSHR
jgi:hypothetical protein